MKTPDSRKIKFEVFPDARESSTRGRNLPPVQAPRKRTELRRGVAPLELLLQLLHLPPEGLGGLLRMDDRLVRISGGGLFPVFGSLAPARAVRLARVLRA